MPRSERRGVSTTSSAGVSNDPIRTLTDHSDRIIVTDDTAAIESVIPDTEDLQQIGAHTTVRGLRSIRDIVADLSRTPPTRFIRTRRQGGTEIRYIAWHDATKLLDFYASGWHYEVRSIDHIAGKVVMTVRLLIPCQEGLVCREATGSEMDVTSSYGDPFSNAESMALRRAAAKFGLGRFLYNG